jgi:DNA-binding MarR family transcriptional regulator
VQPSESVNSHSQYDESILRALRRIIRAVDLYSRQLSIRHSLTGPQLVCLRQLLQSGAMTPGQLAREVSLSPATISGILDRLEKRGYLTRTRRPEDKRQVLVELTASGESLVERTPLPLHERFTRRLAELPESRQSEIDRVLQQVVEMMEAEEIDAAPLLANWPSAGENGRVRPLASNGTPHQSDPESGRTSVTDHHGPIANRN